MSAKTLLIVLGVVVLASTASLVHRLSQRKQTTTDFPDGMHWVCAACGHGFSTPREEFAAWAKDHDERLPCPECNENATQVAQRCPLKGCGAYHVENNVVIDGTVCCPVCRNPIP